MTLVELFAELGATEMMSRRSDALLDVAIVALPDGRNILAIERAYRDGIRLIFDPTTQEIETAHRGDLWELWNTDRAVLIASVF